MSARRVAVLRERERPIFVTHAKAERMVETGAAKWVGTEGRKIRLIKKGEEIALSDGRPSVSQVWGLLRRLYPLRGVRGGQIRPHVGFASRRSLGS